MFKISNYDHVGVRVTDRERSVEFYGRLGFFPEFNEDSPEHNAIGLINDAGVRINLIYNGIERPENRNILMDEAEKYSGFTHPAFVVDSLDAVIALMNEQRISITEGPVELGGRRVICFIRDPDGNVLEFDELYEEGRESAREERWNLDYLSMGKNKMRKLYSHSLSGNSYKVRLFMELLNLEYDEIPVDIPQGKHKSADFLAINPLGQVPVLSEGEVTIRDSQAILVYLARKYGGEKWLPVEPADMAKVMQWLSFAANEIHHGPNLARLHFLLGVEVDLKLVQERSHAVLKIMNEHLANCDWLELTRPTIADLACFPYAALSSEGGVPLEGYPNVESWIDRVKGLPNYVSMPGL